jgi:hypothetical protein
MSKKDIVFSVSKGIDRVEVVRAKLDSFDVVYSYGFEEPVVVGTSSLPMAMYMVREYLEQTAVEN